MKLQICLFLVVWICVIPRCVSQDGYKLPWSCGTTHYCTAGNGQGEHSGIDEYGFDFQMNMATEVRAMKSGVVTMVVENFPDNNCPYVNNDCDDGCINDYNRVVIDHLDGYYSLYIHLKQNSILDTVGQFVNQGEIIGLSGNSGCSSGPHLHIMLMNSNTCGPNVYCQSVEFNFEDVCSNGGVPIGGQSYEACENCCVSVGTNNLCSNATQLIPNPSASFVAGSTCQATATSIPYPQNCLLEGSEALDVWYYFVATDTTTTIEVQSGNDFDAIVQVFTDVECGTNYTANQCVNQTGANGLESILLNQLQVGDQYWIRIYNNSGFQGFDFMIRAINSSNTLTGSLIMEWNRHYGGDNAEYFEILEQTSDNGFILGGTSASDISGDKSQDSQGGDDYWVIKVDGGGVKEWDYRFGGEGVDRLSSLIQTSDGGYFLGGRSNSSSSGDKTETSRGGYDYWVLKLDSLGQKEWDKTFGGDSLEMLASVLESDDGGYLLAGYSRSSISGDKTVANWGNSYSDFWIVKISNAGTKEWDQRYGTYNHNLCTSACNATGGGYLLGGNTFLGSSGNVSEEVLSMDFWILKIDELGNQLWDKCFGGTEEDLVFKILSTSDGGFLLGGITYSHFAGGDIETDSFGGSDYWIVKINSDGTMQWNSRFGGSEDDQIEDIEELMNGKFLIAGNSTSGISGDKSHPSEGGKDIWLLLVDATGNKIWDWAFGGNADDWTAQIEQTSNGNYVLGCETISWLIGGNIPPLNNREFWLASTTSFISEPFLGDINGDSSVSLSDLLLIIGSFGCVNGCDPYDLDGDGLVTTMDIMLFLSLIDTQ